MTAGQSEERELRLCPRGFITRATPWLCGPCRLGRGTGRKKIEVCCGAQRLAKGNSGLQLARRTPSPTGSARGIREIGDAGGVSDSMRGDGGEQFPAEVRDVQLGREWPRRLEGGVRNSGGISGGI